MITVIADRRFPIDLSFEQATSRPSVPSVRGATTPASSAIGPGDTGQFAPSCGIPVVGEPQVVAEVNLLWFGTYLTFETVHDACAVMVAAINLNSHRLACQRLEFSRRIGRDYFNTLGPAAYAELLVLFVRLEITEKNDIISITRRWFCSFEVSVGKVHILLPVVFGQAMTASTNMIADPAILDWVI